MVLIQRSGDMLTASGAGGINEIQYAALLMMIARVTGKEPGVFTHFVANEQIYDRHMENADEMLRRAAELESAERASGEAPAAPQLVLHKESGCEFSDITLEDFEMINYEPLTPQLKFELGI
jgi:thymidylate synthase